jgi:hypothetical protein
MFAGIVFIVLALVLMAVGAILPRVNAQLKATLDSLPKGMQALAAQMSPQAAFAMKASTILPRIAVVCFGAGGVAIALAVAAFVMQPTPIALTVLAWIALVLLVVGGGGLYLAVKKFGGMASKMAGGLRR